MHYLKASNDLNGVLTLIEICARLMANPAESAGLRSAVGGPTADPAEGLVELNDRFLGAGVGYQFENGQIIRVDSQCVHAEVVKEALRLLCDPEFRGSERRVHDGSPPPQGREPAGLQYRGAPGDGNGAEGYLRQ